MPNGVQKFFYNSASIAPCLFASGVSLCIENHKWYLILAAFTISTVIIIYQFVFLHSCRNVLIADSVTISGVRPDDKWIISYIAAYLVPFAGNIIPEQIQIWPYVLAVFGTIIISVLNHDTLHNPVLRLVGYHFYNVDLTTGVGDYQLITRRKIRNAKQIKKTHRVFEYLLLEAKNV